MLKTTDIMNLADFEAIRKNKLNDILGLKKSLKLSVGPDITFHFENTQTIWWQIQEMLRIEKGGIEQIEDELNAYNPLIPQKTLAGYEISATLMIEIDDPVRRHIVLKQLYGIDHNINLEWGNCTAKALSIEPTEERNRESDNKTSSVHFIKWIIPNSEVSNFLERECVLQINHPHYHYSAVLSEILKKNLQEDFQNI